MKIFSAAQIRAWEAFTEKEQAIGSIELMERAAYACSNWLMETHHLHERIHIFCGKGNNGGDGLALARLLVNTGTNVSVYTLEGTGSSSFEINLARLKGFLHPNVLITPEDFPNIQPGDLVIEALLGIGLNKPIDELCAQIIEFLNDSKATIISIDIPAGISPDLPSGPVAIKATHTLSFHNYKRGFFFPENEDHIGQVHLLDIGLSQTFEMNEPADFEMPSMDFIRTLVKPRRQFSHKGNYGHAALVCGSYGMMGAAVLAAMGCLASGAGKLTCYIPSCGYEIMQTSVPEAMCVTDGAKRIKSLKTLATYDAIGAGPGLSQHKDIVDCIQKMYAKKATLVLDADALNVIASNKKLLLSVPPGTILTPHPGEFDRLFGVTADVHYTTLREAKKHKLYLIRKGKYTLVASPDGKGYFIGTGNAGMAKGGMGDVLTGIITGLLAQKYSALESCLLGTYIHGLAGDLAVKNLSQQSMQASDLVTYMGEAWKELQN